MLTNTPNTNVRMKPTRVSHMAGTIAYGIPSNSPTVQCIEDQESSEDVINPRVRTKSRLRHITDTVTS